MNTRYEHERDYITQQTLLMGLATGGGLGDLPVPAMSQSYRRAVVRNPPKGEYMLDVLPPTKQGSGWHYGGVIRPSDSPLSEQPTRTYTIWRKWEDCLELQKIVQREFSYLSARKRKHLGQDSGNNFYQQGMGRAASFDSLPSGPDPLSMALDVHTYLPKLSKKTTLFGKPSVELLAQRAHDFQAFVEGVFSLHTPLMDEVIQQREVRDWFGYWRRDQEGEKKSATALKAQGVSVPPSPSTGSLGLSPNLLLTPAEDHSEILPSAPPPPRFSASSESRSSAADNSRDSSRSESGVEEADDELIDSFPLTPRGLPPTTSSPFTHVTDGTRRDQPYSLSISARDSPVSPILHRPKPFTPPSAGFSAGGIMAPAPTSRSKSTSDPPQGPPYPRPSAALASATSSSVPTITAPTPRHANSFSAPNSSLIRSVQPASPSPITPSPDSQPRARVPRRSGAAGGTFSAANRQGRIFMVEQERSQSTTPPQRPSRFSVPVQPFTDLERFPTAVPDRQRSKSAVEATGLLPSEEALTTSPPILRSESYAHEPKSPDTTSTSLATASTFFTDESDDVITPPTSAHSRSSFAVSKSLIPDCLHHRSVHAREGSDVYTVGSLIDGVLPWAGAHRFEENNAMAPAVTGRRKGSGNGHSKSTRSRGTRHSISGSDSYWSDSSIDAALSTMRFGQHVTSGPGSDVPIGTSPEGSGNAPLRSSMSTSGSSCWSGHGQGMMDESECGLQALDPEMANHLSGRINPPALHLSMAQVRSALAEDQDSDPIDPYYYGSSSTTRSSIELPRHRRSMSSSPLPTTTTSSKSGHTRLSESITSYAGIPDDQFPVKVIYPSNTDCAAVALRIHRSSSFEEFHDRLNTKLRTADGLDLAVLHKGFKIGYRPAPPPREPRDSTVSSSEGSTDSSITGRACSLSNSGSATVNSASLTIIKNLADWQLAIPRGKAKLTLHIVVDN